VFTVSLIIDPLVQVMRPSLGRRDRAGLVRERQRASARRRELAGEQAPTRRWWRRAPPSCACGD